MTRTHGDVILTGGWVDSIPERPVECCSEFSSLDGASITVVGTSRVGCRCEPKTPPRRARFAAVGQNPCVPYMAAVPFPAPMVGGGDGGKI
jgi:hypothetical protein